MKVRSKQAAADPEAVGRSICNTAEHYPLRTPGERPGTMSFVNTDKTIMDAGYEVGSDGMRVKPAIWLETAVEG